MNNDKAIEILNKVEVLPCGYCYQGGKEFEEAIALAIHVLNIHESLEKKIEYLTKEKHDCSSCARYSEFQKEIPDECKGCKHNYFSNYKEKVK